jgi:hypothetical protein
MELILEFEMHKTKKINPLDRLRILDFYKFWKKIIKNINHEDREQLSRIIGNLNQYAENSISKHGPRSSAPPRSVTPRNSAPTRSSHRGSPPPRSTIRSSPPRSPISHVNRNERTVDDDIDDYIMNYFNMRSVPYTTPSWFFPILPKKNGEKFLGTISSPDKIKEWANVVTNIINNYFLYKDKFLPEEEKRLKDFSNCFYKPRELPYDFQVTLGMLKKQFPKKSWW